MSGQMPKVSVVIATYNHGDYVAAAVESVLAQDYPDVELIVVDDGSTDHTEKVLRAFASRAQLVRQDNAGQARALNRGWSMAQGELLAYLGADDVLERTAASALVAALAEAPGAVLAYGDYLMIDSSGRPLRRVTAGDFDHRAMLTRLVCYPGPATVFRRSALAAAGPWDERLRQIPDFEFWLRLAALGPFVRVPAPLARYRAHGGSQSFSVVAAERAEEPVQVMSRFFEQAGLAPDLRRLRATSLSGAHLISARLHLRSDRALHAWRHFADACRLRPAALLTPWTYRIVLNALRVRALERMRGARAS